MKKDIWPTLNADGEALAWVDRYLVIESLFGCERRWTPSVRTSAGATRILA